jgi:purine-nucleoside phosphorylase
VSADPSPAAGAGLVERLTQAVGLIQGRSALRPSIGLVLGSGLGAFAKTLESAVRIPYAEIPHFPRSTVSGHQGELVIGTSGGVSVAVLAGRSHYYEGHSLADVVFPVRVLAHAGIRSLVLTNAAGSVNVDYRPGELMIIDDHINFIGNPLLGPNEEALGPRFPDMSDAYDVRLREVAEKACAGAGVIARHGVYIAMTGPSYETPAEIRMARTLGADAVGMSTAPDVVAARHMGVRVLGLSCLTNMAAGVLKKKLDHKEVLEVGEKVKDALLDVLARIVQETAKAA